MGKCIYCSKKIKDDGSMIRKIFCSDACRTLWSGVESKEPPKMEYTFFCENCEKEFQTNDKSKLYCSNKCKKEHMERKKMDPLARKAMEARKKGITYGELIGREYWETEVLRMRFKQQAISDAARRKKEVE